MGFFKLGTMTIGSVFKKPETLKYPFETKEPYKDQKGTIINDKPADCTLCGICQKRCPANAITVTRDKRTWEINHLTCIQCGYCIQSCPKKCLVMKGDKLSVAIDKKNAIVNIPEKVKKPAEAIKNDADSSKASVKTESKTDTKVKDTEK